jgi:hypothetical protein
MDDPAARLRDTLYTAVGFGVLGIQQAQLRRRQLQKDLARLAAEVEPVLDDVEAKLPDDLRPLLVQVRTTARALLGLR